MSLANAGTIGLMLTGGQHACISFKVACFAGPSVVAHSSLRLKTEALDLSPWAHVPGSAVESLGIDEFQHLSLLSLS